MPEC